MHLKTYLKALLSAIHEYFELIGKIQAYIGAALAIMAIFFSISFPDYLGKFEPYLPQIIILVIFIVLFLSGYKAWLKLYQKTKDVHVFNIENFESQVGCTSFNMGINLKEITIAIAYTIYNNADFIIRITEINQKDFFKKVGLSGGTNSTMLNPRLPIIVQPKSTIDFVTITEFDIASVTYVDQLDLIGKIKNIKGKTHFTVSSVSGRKSLEAETTLDSEKFLNELLANQFRLDPVPIEKTLEKFH